MLREYRLSLSVIALIVIFYSAMVLMNKRSPSASSAPMKPSTAAQIMGSGEQ